MDQTFNILDINAEGVITVDDIAMAYNVDLNPKVIEVLGNVLRRPLKKRNKIIKHLKAKRYPPILVCPLSQQCV